MNQLLAGIVGDLGNVLRTIRAGYCRWTSALMILIVVMTAFDMFAYENHVDLPLGQALARAAATVSLPQGARAAALAVLPALTLLVIAGLLRSRRLAAPGRRLLERIEAVQPAPVGALHVWTFWIAVSVWVAYLVIGPHLVRSAGYWFDGETTRNLYQPLVLPVMNRVSSFGNWLMVSLMTVLGATGVEFVRRMMAGKKPIPPQPVPDGTVATTDATEAASGSADEPSIATAPVPPISRFPLPSAVEKRPQPDKGERSKRPPKSG